MKKPLPLISCLALLALLSACGGVEQPLSATCPDWGGDPTSNHGNHDLRNYGCAYWSNLSAQLQDPADLELGHGVVEQDPYRNSASIDAYRNPQTTSATASASAQTVQTIATPGTSATQGQ